MICSSMYSVTLSGDILLTSAWGKASFPPPTKPVATAAYRLQLGRKEDSTDSQVLYSKGSHW